MVSNGPSAGHYVQILEKSAVTSKVFETEENSNQE